MESLLSIDMGTPDVFPSAYLIIYCEVLLATPIDHTYVPMPYVVSTLHTQYNIGESCLVMIAWQCYVQLKITSEGRNGSAKKY